MPYFHLGSNRPISSLILLWKRRTNLLVWLGVLSMALQILFGPFVQQAISLPTRELISDQGFVSRTWSYSAPPAIIWPVDANNTRSIRGSPGLMNAAELGLIQDHLNPSDVAGSCPTGNCTFGNFTTLGVCSSVEDVTSSIVELPCLYGHSALGSHDCPYTVQELEKNPPIPNRSYIPRLSTLFIGASCVGSQGRGYPNAPGTLVEFYVIYQPVLDLRDFPQDHFNRSTLAALKGSLSLCSYTYNSSMEFGVTTTNVLAKDTSLVWNDKPNPVYLWADGGELDIKQEDLQDMIEYLQMGVFVGNASMAGDDTSTFTSTAAVGIGRHLYGSVQGVQASDGVKALSDLMENVATSLTNFFRTSTITPSYHKGNATSHEVYFSVSWAWLIGPILSIPLTIAFLAATILRSRHLGIPAWKSSQLASLLALDPETRTALGNGMSSQSRTDIATKKSMVNVQLMARPGGKWELGKLD